MTEEKRKRGASTGNKFAAKEKPATTKFSTRLTQEQKDLYMAYAENCGLSLTKLITNLLDTAISADKFKI